MVVALVAIATTVPIGYKERKEGRERERGEIRNKNTPLNHEHPQVSYPILVHPCPLGLSFCGTC
jgi:hypothetical protein